MTNNAAAGSQPGPLPPIDNTHRAPPGNFYPGRAGRTITKYIRHNTEGSSSIAWFLDPASGVSIQHLIARDGTRYDLVQRADTAFHCGDAMIGEYKGVVWVPPAPPAWPQRVKLGVLNLVSEGTEFESTSTRANPGNGYTDAQLWTGAHCEASAIVTWGLMPNRDCLDHLQIAMPPGRRWDPSHFPYDQYFSYVRAWLTFLRTVPEPSLPRYCL